MAKIDWLNPKIRKLQLLQFASNCREFKSLNKFLCSVCKVNEQGAKEKYLTSISFLASSMQLTCTKYRYLQDYRNNKIQIALPVIIVSSSALFMRSIAFSLVGAHTISCKRYAKSINEEEFQIKKTIYCIWVLLTISYLKTQVYIRSCFKI